MYLSRTKRPEFVRIGVQLCQASGLRPCSVTMLETRTAERLPVLRQWPPRISNSTEPICLAMRPVTTWTTASCQRIHPTGNPVPSTAKTSTRGLPEASGSVTSDSRTMSTSSKPTSSFGWLELTARAAPLDVFPCWFISVDVRVGNVRGSALPPQKMRRDGRLRVEHLGARELMCRRCDRRGILLPSEFVQSRCTQGYNLRREVASRRTPLT